MAYNYNYYNRSQRKERSDHLPGHRMEYERNRRKIIASQSICGICGGLVDKSLKYPDPECATVDHIIPVSKGGHPNQLENLQLAHLRCNILKRDRIFSEEQEEKNSECNVNRDLPLSLDWSKYKEDDAENNRTLRHEVERIQAGGLHLYADGIR